jgi:hypothetical protein
MKTDVTDMIQRYRLALRYIWNSSIWTDPNLRNWESVYSFRKLKLPLFQTLIADPLELQRDAIFGEDFEVAPHEAFTDGLPSLQVNMRLPSMPNEGIWHPVPGPFRPEDVSLTLVDLFDWMPLTPR